MNAIAPIKQDLIKIEMTITVAASTPVADLSGHSLTLLPPVMLYQVILPHHQS